MANTEIERCDVVIAVFDSSRPFDDTDFELIEKLKNRPAVAVINKSDLELQADVEAVHAGLGRGLDGGPVPVYCDHRRGQGGSDPNVKFALLSGRACCEKCNTP